MAWILSQNNMILVEANLIRIENGTTITANGVVVGKFDRLSDALAEMTSIERWLDKGGTGVYRISQT